MAAKANKPPQQLPLPPLPSLPLPVLMSWRQVLARYGWSRSRQYALWKAGEIESVQDGRSRRFITASCEARVARLMGGAS
jgi:hypothetical protein